VFESFVSCYDSRTRNPRWVAEALTAAGCAGGEGSASRVGSTFCEDASLPVRFRARLADFRASGYDRGHLAAAANHRGSGAEALRATFTLSNVSPQTGNGFNRDYWARLEKFTRQLTERYAAVHVITGPLFLPQPENDDDTERKAPPPGAPRWRAAWPLLGRPPALVAVPTHFFKVIYAVGGGDEKQPTALGAFVLPNVAIPPAQPLAHFAVPLDALEAAAGLSFFDAPLRGPDGASRAAFLDVEARMMEALPAPPAGRIAGAMPARPALPPPTQEAAAALPAPPALKRLPPPPPPPKDEAPSDQGALVVAAKPQALAVAEPSPALVRAARRAGVPAPLCAAEACRLPAENWWLASNGNGNGNGGASDTE
jgi:DNA/RNA endonuclease G (NUC1)